MVGSRCPIAEVIEKKQSESPPSDSTVLIYGETGTGRRLIARATMIAATARIGLS